MLIHNDISDQLILWDKAHKLHFQALSQIESGDNSSEQSKKDEIDNISSQPQKIDRSPEQESIDPNQIVNSNQILNANHENSQDESNNQESIIIPKIETRTYKTTKSQSGEILVPDKTYEENKLAEEEN